jgi:3-hydroxyisobutyrate dehydrogenase-like beta-hydroxyacid dehydrogenase
VSVVSTVGIISAGEMGSGVGTVLHQHGARVLTVLDGRGERTRERAQAAGMEDVGSLDEFVQQADIVLSILPPAAAPGLARDLAAAVERTRADVLIADCNAVAPGTVRGIAATITASGARFADAGIIGPPPTRPGNRFFTSGPSAEEFSQLRALGLDIRVLEGEAGKASALKMCYAALTKGLQALGTELLVAARLLGVDGALRAEQAQDQSGIVGWLDRGLPTMVPKAYRWIGEMEEIAQCFREVGLPGESFDGFAEIYRRVTEIDDAGPDGFLDRLARASLVHRHADLFNHAVRSGDFAPMLAEFTDDAEMSFEGAAVGPFLGRDAIAEAYRQQPPDDEIEVLDVRPNGQHIEADYAWRRESGKRAGRMIVEPRDNQIARLVVTFE